MTTELPFEQVEAVFHAALDRPAAERNAFLDEACGDDKALRVAVERLLVADARADERIETFQPFPDTAADPYLGRTLGPWRLEERIATGGMGVVYRAARIDGMFEQAVAVKLLRFEAATPDALRRFDAERRTLARLEHPNIARLLDGGTTPYGTPYLVMEFLDGLPIDRWCAERRVSLQQRLALFETVCRAVHFAHKNLVIHRDLKPGNVFVDRQGTPKLLDFGIARLLEKGEAEAHTQLQIYTPDYASPEQLRGDPLTTASDVWSLGVVLYELVTGRRPWDRQSVSAATWERMLSERRPRRPSTVVRDDATDPRRVASLGASPARLRRQLRGDLDRIVLKALQPEPGRRYASAQQLAEDLERFVHGHPVLARDDSVLYRVRCFVARNRLAVAAALIVALALAFGLFAMWRGQRRAESALAVARIAQQRAEAAAAHARTEAGSFGLFARFLGDTFLGSALEASDRERLRKAIVRYADQVRRQHSGDIHLSANLLHALGDTCVRLGLLDEGEALLDEARMQRVAAFGEHSLENALSLASLGRLHFARGDLGRARRMLARALELHRELPLGVHTDVATAANDLATVERGLGGLHEARKLHEKALELRRASFGEQALPVAESRHNLAHVLLDLGEADAAHRHASEALAIRREILGPGHPLALQTAISLAGVELHRGERGAAEDLLREAERGYRALGPEGAEGLFHAVSNLAALRMAEGDATAAGPLADEALVLARKNHGDTHLGVATAWIRVASVALARGELERARYGFGEALRIQREMLPSGHRLLATSLHGLAGVEMRDGEWEAAEAALLEALEIAQGLGASGDDLAARIRLDLAIPVAKLGKKDEARELLERALATFRERHGEDAPTTRAARDRLDRLQ